MTIKDVLAEDRVLFLDASNKSEALEAMLACLEKTPAIQDAQALREGIFHRETLMSTGIGLGVGIPHVRQPTVKEPIMCAGLCRPGLADYESLDHQPVQLIFMIAAGKNQHTEYIRLLSQISTRIQDEQKRTALLTASDPSTFYRHLIEV